MSSCYGAPSVRELEGDLGAMGMEERDWIRIEFVQVVVYMECADNLRHEPTLKDVSQPMLPSFQWMARKNMKCMVHGLNPRHISDQYPPDPLALRILCSNLNGSKVDELRSLQAHNNMSPPACKTNINGGIGAPAWEPSL